MRGVITGKDVLRHALTIVRLWGARCWVRCARAALSRRPSTFLEVVAVGCDCRSLPSTGTGRGE